MGHGTFEHLSSPLIRSSLQSCNTALEAIQGNYSRLAVALESFTEEGLGGGDVTRSTEVGFDGFALFINSAGFWCKLLKGSVSCDNCRDDGTDLGTRSVQGTAL